MANEVDRPCLLCLHDIPRSLNEVRDEELARLAELAQHPGWQVYLELLRRDAQSELWKLVNSDVLDDDLWRIQARVQGMFDRLKFEMYLEAEVEKRIAAAGEAPPPRVSLDQIGEQAREDNP